MIGIAGSTVCMLTEVTVRLCADTCAPGAVECVGDGLRDALDPRTHEKGTRNGQ